MLWPPKDTGVFFGGHCYIVLHTTKADLPTTATDGGNSEQPSLQHEVGFIAGLPLKLIEFNILSF